MVSLAWASSFSLSASYASVSNLVVVTELLLLLSSVPAGCCRIVLNLTSPIPRHPDLRTPCRPPPLAALPPNVTLPVPYS